MTSTQVKKSSSNMKQMQSLTDSRAKSALKTMTRNTVTNNKTTATMRTGRQSAINSQDDSQGPGTYDIKNLSFGSDAKGFTIGRKRESRVEHSPGPGEYEVSRSDSQTKSRVRTSVDFDKTTGRREESPARDSSGDFGTVERFY